MKGYREAAYRYDNLMPEDFMDPQTEAREQEIERILGEEADLAEALEDAAGVFAADVAWFYLRAPIPYEHERRSQADFDLRVERAVGAWVDRRRADSVRY